MIQQLLFVAMVVVPSIIVMFIFFWIGHRLLIYPDLIPAVKNMY
ncbi:MAG: hypothetical protein ACYCY6_00360 [Minisyncoccota bacterium]